MGMPAEEIIEKEVVTEKSEATVEPVEVKDEVSNV